MNRFGLWGLIAILSAALPTTALAQNGTIAGTVTRSDNLQPITSGAVILYAASDFSDVAITQLNENGQYLFNVAPGNYVVLVDAPTYAGEFYDNVPCVSSDLCDPGDATVIALGSSQLKVANFALDPLGTISGTVRRSDTNALVPGISVVAFDNGADPIATATTDANGAYTLYVYDGSFSVRTRNSTTLLDEIWDNVPCNITGCNTNAATPIQVQNGGSVTGKNFVLAPGSQVSGKVRRSVDLPMDETARVEFSDAQGNIVANVGTDFDGNWQLPFAAATGSWRAVAYSITESRYFPQVYSGRACGGANQDVCDASAGDPIVVTVPNAVTNVDFKLVRRTARLEGTVTELAGGEPVAGAFVAAFDAETIAEAGSTGTGSNGNYLFELPPGRYVLYVRPPFAPRPAPGPKHGDESDLLGEVHPGLQCFGEPPYCGSPATALELEANEDLAGLDFALAPAAHVLVSLKNQNTNALMEGTLKLLHPGTTAPLFELLLSPVATQVQVLNGGTLRLAGTASTCGPAGNRVCRGERNDGTTCVGLACDLTVAAGIAVTKGGDAGSVEFLLDAGRRAGGVVRDAGTQAGIPDVAVEFSIGDVQVAQGLTAGDGSYEIGGLSAGPYYARTRASFGYLDELYLELPCPPGQCTFSTGEPFVPPVDTNQAKTDVDFTLDPGGAIRGTVRDAGTVQFVGGAQVSVFDGAGAKVADATTLFDGKYTTRALPAGNYTVSATRSGYSSELYDEKPCPGNVCAPLNGTAVPVIAASDTTGIDFTLAPDATSVPPKRRIFLNRCSPSCNVTGGFNSSINNTSSIISGNRLLSTSLTDPWFDAFVGCVKDMFSPFNAEILTTDPGAVPHQEVMLGATPVQAGFENGVGGVSPWSCGDIQNTIVFGFTLGQDPQTVCETAAMELGHSFGLDHEYLCEDPMTYLLGCGAKRFQDVDAPCGEGAPRICECGSDTQNSYRRLLLTLGASPSIFSDGFEQGPPAAKAGEFEKVFGTKRKSGSVFDPYLQPLQDDRRRPRDRL